MRCAIALSSWEHAEEFLERLDHFLTIVDRAAVAAGNA